MRRHDDHADGSGIQSGQAPQACLAADRAKKPVCLGGLATASPATACPLISWGRHPRTPERLCGLLRALRVPPSAGWWTTTRAPPKPLRPHARASRPGAPGPSPAPPRPTARQGASSGAGLRPHKTPERRAADFLGVDMRTGHAPLWGRGHPSAGPESAAGDTQTTEPSLRSPSRRGGPRNAGGATAPSEHKIFLDGVILKIQALFW